MNFFGRHTFIQNPRFTTSGPWRDALLATSSLPAASQARAAMDQEEEGGRKRDREEGGARGEGGAVTRTTDGAGSRKTADLVVRC